MALSKGKVGVIFLIILMSPLLLWILLWISITLSRDVYQHQLSESGLWPIICSTRGCVTTSGWHKHYRARQVFARETGQTAPTPEEALTTLARQYLVDKALGDSPVTLASARRYREEVLQAKDEDKILKATGLNLDDYDELVILPLLKQEVLRQRKKSANLEEMFGQLAKERKLWVLPVGLVWDKETAEVKQK